MNNPVGLGRLTIRCSIIPAVLAVFIGAGCRSGFDHIPGEWRFIKDSQGRSLILRGVNASGSAKSDPQRMPNLTRDDVLRLSGDWGFNMARFLILWDHAEPAPGSYNLEYFDLVEKRLDWFREAGIVVILDMHQDLYSQTTCGDGAPPWAVITDGLSFTCQSVWAFTYFEPGVTRAFDNFWNYSGPHPELQDRYIALWAAVAARFKNHQAVLGYDIINEPFPGSDFDKTEIALGKDNPSGPSPLFDRTKLQLFYQRAVNAIRRVDADHWIFFEPRYGSPAAGLSSYIGRLNDPRAGGSRVAYFPHLYSLLLEAGAAYEPTTNPIIPLWEKTRAQESDALRYPLLLGEWGIQHAVQNGPQFLRDVLDMADRQMAGWAYWDYSPGSYGFIVNDPLRSEYITFTSVLIRVYPQRVAGVPQSFEYDPDTRIFRMEYLGDPKAAGPTEIYIPAARIYPSGWDLTMSDAAGSWTMQWDPVKEVASVTTARGAAVSSHIVEVRPR